MLDTSLCLKSSCPAYKSYSKLARSSDQTAKLIKRHKSYHPYLEKNKQRVREDEAKAAEAELAKEQKRVEKVCPPFISTEGILSEKAKS